MNDSFPSHSFLDIPIDRRQLLERFNLQDLVVSSIITSTTRKTVSFERGSSLWPFLRIDPSNQTNQADQANEANQTPLIDRDVRKDPDRYEYAFNKEILFKSFLYYTCYYFVGLWIPLLILNCFPKCCEKWYLVRNLNRRTHWREIMVSFICLSVPCGFLSFKKDFEILMPLVIGLWINTIFVIVSQVVIVAYTNQKNSNLILNKTLKGHEMNSFKEIEILYPEDELRDTFNRLNINAFHLYFNYMDDLPREIDNVNRETERTGGRDNEGTEPEDNVVEASMLEERSKFGNWLRDRTRLDGGKLFGYDLALKLLRSIKEPAFQAYKSPLYWLGILLAFGLAFVGYPRMPSSDSGWQEFFILSLAIFYILSFLITVVYILEITYIGISNLKRRKRFMLELEELITFGKPEVLNILDEMSLSTWMELRKTFMHYGDRQMEIMSLIIAGFIGLYIIAILAFFASKFIKGSSILNDWYKLVELLNIGVIYLVLFVVQIIYLALSINMQFNIHRGLILKSQNKTVEMYRVSPYYLKGELTLENNNSFEAQALRFLKKKLQIPEYIDLKKKQKKRIQDKIDLQRGKSKEVYDLIWREFEYEEKTHPIKLAQIKITPELVIALAAALGSAFFNAIFSLFT